MSTKSPKMIDLSVPFIERLSRRQRIARIIILCLFATTLTGGLVITQINVKRGLIVYSNEQEDRIAGSEMVLRVEGRSLPFRQSIRLTSVHVQLQDQKKNVLIRHILKPALEAMWQGEITLPKIAGKYELSIVAEGFEHPSVNHGKMPKVPVFLNAKTTINVVEARQSPLLWPLLAQTPTTARQRLGEGTLSFYPMDQRLTSELPSDIILIAQDSDSLPWQGAVTLKHLEGLLARPLNTPLDVNHLGIGIFTVIPRSMGLRLRVEANIESEDRDEDILTSSDERFSPRAHQFNLLPTQRIVRSNRQILFDVQSTYPGSILYVDLWRANEWLSTTTMETITHSAHSRIGGLRSRGQGSIAIPDLRENLPQLLWLQTYQLPYQIDEVRGGAYLLWIPTKMTKTDLAQWLLTQVTQLEMEPSGYWQNLKPKDLVKNNIIRTLLGRLSRPQANPSVLINSGVSAQITAERQRASYMKLYLEFMAALCLVTILWLITLVSLTYKKHISSPEWSDQGSIKQARKIAISWLAPMIMILMIFFGAMILLVFKISW